MNYNEFYKAIERLWINTYEGYMVLSVKSPSELIKKLSDDDMALMMCSHTVVCNDCYRCSDCGQYPPEKMIK